MWVVLGASGNVGSKTAAGLLERGQKVRVVARHAERLEPLARRGAEVATGDLADAGFLARVLAGADGAFTMIPPVYDADDLLEAQAPLVESVAHALETAGIPRVLNLSSIGAERSGGTGPIVALHRAEQRFAGLRRARVLHLRAGYFMENLLPQVEASRELGFLPGQIDAAAMVEMIATRDIAAEAVAAAFEHEAEGHDVLNVLGPAPVTMPQAAHEMGKALGLRDLAYRRVPDEVAERSMLGAGFTPGTVRLMTELQGFLSREEAQPIGRVHRGNTTLGAFFASARLPAS